MYTVLVDMSFDHVSPVHPGACHSLVGPRVADAKSVGQTCSSAPLSTRILAFPSLDALTANIQNQSHCLQLLQQLQLEVCFFGLSSPSCTGPLAFPLSCPSYSFTFMHFTCQMSIGADVSWAMCRPRSLARVHARVGKTHDLPREPLSGDHGKLLMRVPSTVAT